MTLRDILHGKGAHVHTTIPRATIRRVVELLVQHNCGSLVVTREETSDEMVGIITERDIMCACAAGRSLESTFVEDVMTQSVVTGSLTDDLESAMGLMTKRRVRHLPVVQGDRLVGMISIGDVVKAQHDALTTENHLLKHYIHDSGIFA